MVRAKTRWAAMMLRLLGHAWVALALLATGCYQIICSFPEDWGEVGLRVVYIDHSTCDGCKELEPGDRIETLDGEPVHVDLEALRDGESHVVEYWDRSVDARATATITVTPLAEPTGALPIFAVDVYELKHTPSWARRRMFGHAVPELLLIGEDGQPLTGLDLYGRRHVVVLFDWIASSDHQNAALSMQVLQKAQADLLAKDIAIVFAHVAHPTASAQPPMNDADLQAFFANNQIKPSEGGPLPPPPLYRMPNKTERDKPRGIEPINYVERLGEAPNILLIDERGIILWHSAGSVPDPEGKITVDMVYTINKAVLFALELP